MQLKLSHMAAAAALAGFLGFGGMSLAYAQDSTTTTEDDSATTDDSTTTTEDDSATTDDSTTDDNSANHDEDCPNMGESPSDSPAPDGSSL